VWTSRRHPIFDSECERPIRRCIPHSRCVKVYDEIRQFEVSVLDGWRRTTKRDMASWTFFDRYAQEDLLNSVVTVDETWVDYYSHPNYTVCKRFDDGDEMKERVNDCWLWGRHTNAASATTKMRRLRRR